MTPLRELQPRLQQLKTGCDQLSGIYFAQQQTVESLQQEVSALSAEAKVLTLTNGALDQLLRSVSLESLESIERLVTYGLRVVFQDQTLALNIDVTSKRNTQWMDLKLIHNGVEANILDSFGGGPAALTAFLLRLLVVRRMKLYPLILLDEDFSFVSAEYRENLGKLLRELAEQLGFTILLVTHLPELSRQASVAYEAVETSSGTIFRQLKQ